MKLNAEDICKEAIKDAVEDILAGSYNAEGIQRWWDRPRWAIGGWTPQQAFDRGHYQAVLNLAHWGTQN